MKSNVYRWGPPVLLMAIIFFASATPGTDIPGFGSLDMFVKKAGHMLGYALLAIAVYHALNNGRRGRKLLFVLSICIVALYAASDEYHQMFTPGRNASVADVGIDVTGAFLGVAVMCKVQKFISGPDKERLEDGA